MKFLALRHTAAITAAVGFGFLYACSSKGPIQSKTLSEEDFIRVVERAPKFKKPDVLEFSHQMATYRAFEPCEAGMRGQLELIALSLGRLEVRAPYGCTLTLTPEGERLKAADPEATDAEPPRPGTNSVIPGKAGHFKVPFARRKMIKALEFVDTGAGTAKGRFAYTMEPIDSDITKKVRAECPPSLIAGAVCGTGFLNHVPPGLSGRTILTRYS